MFKQLIKQNEQQTVHVYMHSRHQQINYNKQEDSENTLFNHPTWQEKPNNIYTKLPLPWGQKLSINPTKRA